MSQWLSSFVLIRYTAQEEDHRKMALDAFNTARVDGPTLLTLTAEKLQKKPYNFQESDSVALFQAIESLKRTLFVYSMYSCTRYRSR